MASSTEILIFLIVFSCARAQARTRFSLSDGELAQPQPAIIQATVAKVLSTKVLNLEQQSVSNIVVPKLALPLPECGTLKEYTCYRLVTGCYCLVTQQMTWRNASDYCQANGRSLLSITTEEKQKDMELNLALTIPEPASIALQMGLWTSGAYFKQARKFLWLSAGYQNPLIFTFEKWLPNQPNVEQILPVDACVRLIPSLQTSWDDIGCDQLLPFVCEH